jgi:hypothetical protein
LYGVIASSTRAALMVAKWQQAAATAVNDNGNGNMIVASTTSKQRTKEEKEEIPSPQQHPMGNNTNDEHDIFMDAALEAKGVATRTQIDKELKSIRLRNERDSFTYLNKINETSIILLHIPYAILAMICQYLTMLDHIRLSSTTSSLYDKLVKRLISTPSLIHNGNDVHNMVTTSSSSTATAVTGIGVSGSESMSKGIPESTPSHDFIVVHDVSSGDAEIASKIARLQRFKPRHLIISVEAGWKDDTFKLMTTLERLEFRRQLYQPLSTLRHMTRLTSLAIQTPIDLRRYGLPSLKQLTLYGSKPMEASWLLPTITELALPWVEWNPKSLPMRRLILQSLPQLHKLTLQLPSPGQGIVSSDLELIFFYASSTLEILELTNTEIISRIFLGYTIPQLREFILTRPTTTSDDYIPTMVTCFPNLTHLQCSLCSLTSVHAIANGLPKLIRLSLTLTLRQPWFNNNNTMATTDAMDAQTNAVLSSLISSSRIVNALYSLTLMIRPLSTIPSFLPTSLPQWASLITNFRSLTRLLIDTSGGSWHLHTIARATWSPQPSSPPSTPPSTSASSTTPSSHDVIENKIDKEVLASLTSLSIKQSTSSSSSFSSSFMSGTSSKVEEQKRWPPLPIWRRARHGHDVNDGGIWPLLNRVEFLTPFDSTHVRTNIQYVLGAAVVAATDMGPSPSASSTLTLTSLLEGIHLSFDPPLPVSLVHQLLALGRPTSMGCHVDKDPIEGLPFKNRREFTNDVVRILQAAGIVVWKNGASLEPPSISSPTSDASLQVSTSTTASSS